MLRKLPPKWALTATQSRKGHCFITHKWRDAWNIEMCAPYKRCMAANSNHVASTKIKIVTGNMQWAQFWRDHTQTSKYESSLISTRWMFLLGWANDGLAGINDDVDEGKPFVFFWLVVCLSITLESCVIQQRDHWKWAHLSEWSICSSMRTNSWLCEPSTNLKELLCCWWHGVHAKGERRLHTASCSSGVIIWSVPHVSRRKPTWNICAAVRMTLIIFWRRAMVLETFSPLIFSPTAAIFFAKRKKICENTEINEARRDRLWQLYGLYHQKWQFSFLCHMKLRHGTDGDE